MSEHINCMICGAAVHAIQKHLETDHGPTSESPMTLDEYREKYPKAPLLSKKLLERMEQKRKEQEAMASGNKRSFEELFKLHGIPAAKTPAGKDIMIDVCEPKDPDLVPEWDDGYIPNIDAYKNILLSFSKNKPIYLYGMPGLGKSSIFKQVCAATNRSLVRVQHTINTEESHIVGEKMPVRKVDEKTGESYTTIEFQLGPLPEAMLNGHVYLADEYDRALPQVLSVYQAVLEGEPLYIKEAPPHLRLIRPHPDFRFAATGNTNGAGDDMGLFNAAMQQDAATFERFSICYRVEYMSEQEEVSLLVKKVKLNKKHAAQIRKYADRVRESFPHEIPLSMGPRVLLNLAEIGVAKGCFVKGAELSFANRLPDGPRKVALDLANRLFLGKE